MPILLILLMLCLIFRATVTMSAASAACRLFVTAVLPGLFPYMVLSLMLTSRVKRLSPGIVLLLGWGGGSPTGARLLTLCTALTRRQQVRLAVSCATMSPMFLLGTVGGWLGSTAAGAVMLISVIAGGWLAGSMAGAEIRRSEHCSPAHAFQPAQENPLTHQGRRSPQAEAISFGGAVEQSARTMLLVCGTMVMLRVFAAMAGEWLPAGLVLPVTTLLEVTTGAQEIAALPLPLPMRTALLAGATGFGGMAILMQNRAVLPRDFLPLRLQLLWQCVHGGLSGLIALGLMCLIC
jgi:hypothetical protein